MINNILTTYNKSADSTCIASYTSSFYIKDDTPHCSSSLVNQNATCFVLKTDEERTYFIAIDNCLVTDSTIQKCDCCITDGISKIIFIELKEMNYSGDTRRDHNRRSKHTKEAVKQIASTINNFKNKGVDFNELSVEAVVSYPPYTGETNPISIPSTASQARINQLNSLCGHTDLFVGNHVIFP